MFLLIYLFNSLFATLIIICYTIVALFILKFDISGEKNYNDYYLKLISF